MTLPIITADIDAHLDWHGLLGAFERAHALPPAELDDTFLYRGDDTLLSRAAWIDGMGALVKTATIFPGNTDKGLAAVNGGVSLYSDADGTLEALLDFHLVTKWKTAGDSLFAANLLARPDSHKITLVGAGTVARSMVDAYRALFPDAQFTVWSRRFESAAQFAQKLDGVQPEADLQRAVEGADIICTATMSRAPLIQGEWLQPGQHLDLIGAFRPDMREVDDTALQRAALFVDNRRTVLDHIGEMKDPLSRGVISHDDICADFYDIAAGRFVRPSPDAITICKNGGGAHLDLMTARYIFGAWQKMQGQ
ncbi:ornithine cyclodeaminase family protein [Roseinatronobacter bogoriensis]|uniref:Ornithine cyclodeaminase n=1 Tax=Roseinatronobacter bogoriensis subsp. barguzinensis TaxID=441209 RepID=A0A2K8K7N3_9RHOB|nr:ornithine cyclodeaminase [Rhodobaca]ATX65461.1 ornithine cyclodeaminase [Rhodobaca barguzinensis]MBB4209051.1 ornithine cyclodeaminase [Rhodobaca bogoriensis DSM 18756]TDW37523.1 ornithine cyclodeaminase [Rhodobaca barguzinensis]TDY68134.1 ornithine cyclodeaminase [Rhodobaca bogoriensis DSM 18756]